MGNTNGDLFPQEAEAVEGREHGLFISGCLQSQSHEEWGQKRKLKMQSGLRQTIKQTHTEHQLGQTLSVHPTRFLFFLGTQLDYIA